MRTDHRQPAEALDVAAPEHPATRAELDELRAAVTALLAVVQRLGAPRGAAAVAPPGLSDDDRYLLSAHITLLRAREAALRAGEDG